MEEKSTNLYFGAPSAVEFLPHYVNDTKTSFETLNVAPGRALQRQLRLLCIECLVNHISFVASGCPRSLLPSMTFVLIYSQL